MSNERDRDGLWPFDANTTIALGFIVACHVSFLLGFMAGRV